MEHQGDEIHKAINSGLLVSELEPPQTQNLKVLINQFQAQENLERVFYLIVFILFASFTGYTFYNFSKLKKIQQELILEKQNAEKLANVKSNFLATMSHEIRTPISGLVGILNLFAETPMTDQQRNFHSIAMMSVRALSEIINDILDYSKLDAGKIVINPQPFSLGELLRDIEAMAQPAALEKGLLISLHIQDKIPDNYIGDSARIRQILINLISNASKFTLKGGITIVAQAIPIEIDRFLIRIEVIDTGCGIDVNDQQKLFKDFSQIDDQFTRKHNGSGLGLAICQKLAGLMGGTMGVESQKGAGSTFWLELTLPASTPPQGNEIKQPEIHHALETAPKNDRILLVEDNDVNRIVASQYLEKSGYKADLASNGFEAVENASHIQYDLILMDVSMPEMDGLEASRRIRTHGASKNTPIIALTAHALPEHKTKCLEAGMNDFLTKPLEKQKFLQTVSKWLTAEAQPPTQHVPATPHMDAGEILPHYPNIDTFLIERLAKDLDPITMLRITGAFLSTLPERIEKLSHAFYENNLSTLERECHALCGSSANCGLPKLSALMSEMEQAAKKSSPETLGTLMSQLTPVWHAAQSHLEAERAKYSE